MRPLREYNPKNGFTCRKPLLFTNLQHHANATATSTVGTPARFRTWFPFREWRFESSLRHLVLKGLTANNVVSPFCFPKVFGENLGKTPAHVAVTLARKEALVAALELR